ncbi:MAG: integrase core domain-containing protein [Rhodanobacteraceae bacterium]
MDVPVVAPARRVIRVLDRLCDEHGQPAAIRSDNGPELRSKMVEEWAFKRGIRWDFTQPGCPAQNAYIERFNGTYRNEVLDAHQFRTLSQARRVSEAWRTIYNEQRAHSAIGHLPPKAFKQRWQQRQSLLIAGSE